MKTVLLPSVLLLVVLAAGLRAEPIIIDHTCTSLGKVPNYWVEKAKDEFKITYGHTSHGSQIITGINIVNSDAGSGDSDAISCNGYSCGDRLYAYCDDRGYYSSGSGDLAPSGVLSLWDDYPLGDLGNPDRVTWEARSRTLLNDPRYSNRNVVMWSWCGQADTTESNIQIYLDLMSGLERDYPDVIFVYMTGHLNGTGETGNLFQRNNQIRNHCVGSGAVLFDFADIESYDPDGNYFRDLQAEDDCDYWVSGVKRNWADEWCAAHPGECVSCGSCAHSRCLNCHLKGNAFWWMMARLAGWDGCEAIDGDANGDCRVDLEDVGLLGRYWDESGCVGCGGADLTGDGNVDLLDLQEMAANWLAGVLPG